MRKKRLIWQIYPSYLIITAVSLVVLTWYASQALRQFFFEQTVSELKSRAYLIEKQIANVFLKNSDEIDRLCKELGAKGATRITVIIPSGLVVGDSEENPEQMDNHANRPEIMRALKGQTGKVIRYSHTLEEEMMYVAIPVYRQGRLIAVLRTSIPLTFINQALRNIYKKIAVAVVVVLLLSAFVFWILSRRISRPLEELKIGAQRFAQGDLKHKLFVPESLEIAALAEAMNVMAVQLDDRIQTIVQQRSEREAVLSSMVEGVLAVDTDENLIMLNKAAAKMLSVNPGQVKGRAIQEVIKNIEVQHFIAKTLSAQEQIEAYINIFIAFDRYIRMRGASLRDANGKIIGALLVLNDLTKLRRVENIRKDFVANVSHELKTPITAIKASVETLLDEDKQLSAGRNRFLDIILKQADRLNAIIEDLLSLSRIEQESEKHEIPLKKESVESVIRAAIQLCGTKAAKKNITVDLNCSGEMMTLINPPLLEQAIVNLIDNAIKYSEAENAVQLNVEKNDKEIVICVKDHGCGIEEKHLPRIFERFYRVDKARSRRLGGTGLGLAIVKHIVQAQNGNISVESVPGQGSTFFIRLPIASS